MRNVKTSLSGVFCTIYNDSVVVDGGLLVKLIAEEKTLYEMSYDKATKLIRLEPKIEKVKLEVNGMNLSAHCLWGDYYSYRRDGKYVPSVDVEDFFWECYEYSKLISAS